MTNFAAGLAGIRAAVVAPAWIEESRLGSLTAVSYDSPALATDPKAPPSTHHHAHRVDQTHHARRAAWLMLRLLARLRPQRWRTTCLYRSVAECLALRALDVPCHIELSAGRHPSTGEIEAHAILRADGVDDADAGFQTPFRPAGVSTRGAS